MWNYIENGSVTSVNGFTAAGIHCGLKRKRKDLALIVSELECVAAGTFTLNKVKAAPLLVSQKMIQNKNRVKAILVNSANANACTGEPGLNDALELQKYCANKLGISQSEVVVSSTGVIGERLKMDIYKNGIDAIVPKLDKNGGIDAAESILTTDLVKKNLAVKVKLSDGDVTIGAIAKGSGMIMPNMATMLAFITTDAKISQELLQQYTSKAVNKSFNRIAVDGDTSTNDMVIVLANGKSEITLDENSTDAEIFSDALTDLMQNLAKAIAADGEGATKFVSFNVLNAKTEEDAVAVGRALSISPLVKTAINGEDANWGRIISAVGNSGAEFNPEDVTIKFGELPILDSNYKVVFEEEEAKKVLINKEIDITVDLHAGNFNSTWWSCDFSKEYIHINASYRS